MSLTGQIVGRAWRAWADIRRSALRAGSATSALGSLGTPSRRDLVEWNGRTSREHQRYRREHPPVSRRIAVVCVSMRPHLVDDVVANVERQLPGLELDIVFVANHPGFAAVDVERRFERMGGVTVIATDPGTSLGRALNLGFDATAERFVAKLDDDDFYGHGYLLDSLRAHGYAGAGVVGKHTYYADVGPTGERYLRFPGHEFVYSGTLAGGTLVFDRERVGGLRFDDVSLGEDRAFLAACHRHGVSTFSADRFGFVQRRGTDNTWSVSETDFLIGCQPVDRQHPDHLVDRVERSDGGRHS